MMFDWLKKILRIIWYRPGTTHRILTGPMKGLWFRCSENTGLAAVYSGNEQDNQRVYASVVRPGDTVVDAGANWGVHALYLGRLVGATGRVHAFEPHPQVVEELRWHLQRNGMSHVTVHNCGLLDRAGQLPFVLGDNSKTSHIKGPQEGEAQTTTNIPCLTLDEVIEQAAPVSLRLIKVDVEGAEAQLLKGAERTIQRYRPHLVVELHNPEQDLEVASLLAQWNYHIQRVDGQSILHLDRSWPDPNGVWGTLHAIPR
jgi:FkbM family methyltransferase